MSKGKHEPYDDFKGALKTRRVTYLDVADFLGLSETSIGQKINGASDFTLGEAIKICDKYKMELKIFENKVANSITEDIKGKSPP